MYSLPDTSRRLLLARLANEIRSARAKLDAQPLPMAAGPLRRDDELEPEHLVSIAACLTLWKWAAMCVEELSREIEQADRLLEQRDAVLAYQLERASDEGYAPVEAQDLATRITECFVTDMTRRRDAWEASRTGFLRTIYPHTRERAGAPWRVWDQRVGKSFRDILIPHPGDSPEINAKRDLFLQMAAAVPSLDALSRMRNAEAVVAVLGVLREEQRVSEAAMSVALAIGAVETLEHGTSEVMMQPLGLIATELEGKIAENAVQTVLEEGNEALSRDRKVAAAITIVSELTGEPVGSIKQCYSQRRHEPVCPH